MKDWKTYAIIMLAAWCVLLTCKKFYQGTMLSANVGTLIDCSDTPPVWSNDLQHVEWAQGGENGLLIDCYCKIMPMAPTSNYSKLQRCRLMFSKEGLLVKSELLPESIRLMTNCRADRHPRQPSIEEQEQQRKFFERLPPEERRRAFEQMEQMKSQREQRESGIFNRHRGNGSRLLNDSGKAKSTDSTVKLIQ